MASPKEKDALAILKDSLKNFWRKRGKPSIIAAKHTEFVVEPKVFVGDKLNPEILKLLVINYLKSTSNQDSGTGNIEAAPDKIIIKSKKGRPLVIVRDQNIIQEYFSSKV